MAKQTLYDIDDGARFVWMGEFYTLISVDKHGKAKALNKRGTEETFNACAEIRTAHWQCQSCLHRDARDLPPDREKFYADPKPETCPNCKSEDLAPVGF